MNESRTMFVRGVEIDFEVDREGYVSFSSGSAYRNCEEFNKFMSILKSLQTEDDLAREDMIREHPYGVARKPCPA